METKLSILYDEFDKLSVKLAAIVLFISQPVFTGASNMFLKHFLIPVK